jgi:hypothetical protein
MDNAHVETGKEAAFNYDNQAVTGYFARLLRQQLKPEVWTWLEEKASVKDLQTFNTTFAALPRRTGRQIISLSPEDKSLLSRLVPGSSLRDWTIDRLARVWLLMKLDHSDKEQYFSNIEKLFLTGEMNELVALYSSLPFLAYPEMWKKRCSEGIRSNIADVLQAIMYENPYPAAYLPEPAWNQLVLKAFFTEKSINRITGLDERANPELAQILSDYAHERWAAGRTVNPLMWRCVGKHISQRIFPDIERLMSSANLAEKEAAALACSASSLPEAQALLKGNPAFASRIENGTLNWEQLGAKAEMK